MQDTTTQAAQVIDLPASWVPAQLERVAKANARAARAGITEQYTTSVVEYDATTTDDLGVVRTRRMATVTITGDVLKVPGYTFAATVDWELGAPIVRRNPALPEDMAITAPATKRCEQCGTTRERHDTYLVINDATGELVQVGRNCLAAYCGITPSWVPWGLDLAMTPDEDGEWSMGRREHPTFATRSVLRTSLVICDHYEGYTAKAAGSAAHPATAELVWLVIGSTLRKDDYQYSLQRTVRGLVEQAKDDTALDARVDAVLAWAQGIDLTTEHSDYLANLGTIARSEWLGERHVGLAASMVAGYDRSIVRQAQRQAEQATRGNVETGKAVQVQGVIEKMWDKETDYGTTTKAWVRCANGSRVYTTVPQALKDLANAQGVHGTTEYDDYDHTAIGRSYSAYVGMDVTFTAQVELAHHDPDPTTGFAKRPRKVTINSLPTTTEEA
jgi:hypothetical protein